MSRIGKYPVTFDDKSNVTIVGQMVSVKGAKSTLNYELDSRITAKLDGKNLVLTRKDDSKESKSLHGLYKVLLSNAVKGVSTGFTKSLERKGFKLSSSDFFSHNSFSFSSWKTLRMGFSIK